MKTEDEMKAELAMLHKRRETILDLKAGGLSSLLSYRRPTPERDTRMAYLDGQIASLEFALGLDTITIGDPNEKDSNAVSA